MTNVLRGNWNYPTTVWAGPGRIAELPLACARAGIRRPLLVTDEGLAGTPMIKSAMAAPADAALFGAVRGNPASSHVAAGLRVYRDGRHDGVAAGGHFPGGGGRQSRHRGRRRVTGPRILVIDGNVGEIRARLIAAVGYDSGNGYARVLRRIDPALQIDIVTAADGSPEFQPGVGLEDYDGVTMTGSALNIYKGGEPVMRQIELAKAVFAVGVPFFGSCWGLQVAVTAAGGVVRANPRGREFGFARRILLSDAGREHRLFAGKPVVFEAPTIQDAEVRPHAQRHV